MNTPTNTTQAVETANGFTDELRSLNPGYSEARSVVALRRDLERTAANISRLETAAAGRTLTADERRQESIYRSDHAAIVADLDRLADQAEGRDLSLRSALVHAAASEPGTASTYAIRHAVTSGLELRTLTNSTTNLGRSDVNTTLPELVDAVSGFEGLLLRACRDVVVALAPMTNSVDFTTLATFPSAVVVNEAASATAADPTFGKVTVALTKKAVLTRTSMESIQDAAFDLEAAVVQAHSRAHARAGEAELYAAAIAGAGTSNTVASVNLAALQDLVADVQAAGYSPDVVAVNATDYGNIRKAVGIGAVDLVGAIGAPVVVSSAVPAGRAVAADSRFLIRCRRNITPVVIGRMGPAEFAVDLVACRSVVRSGAAVLAAGAVAIAIP